MQFFRHNLFKKIDLFLSLGGEAVVVVLLIFIPILYPKTAEAGIFSFISGKDASAQTRPVADAPNSQNMMVLRAVVNVEPNVLALSSQPIPVSENALVAEIGPGGTVFEVDEQVPSNKISLYVVREGDTLSDIAEMFNVSVNTILWANDLVRGQTLKKGQTLVILPITGIRYTIKKNDTIRGIVLKHKANLEEVLKYNDISINDTLISGDVLIIPDGEVSVVARSTGAASAPPLYKNYYSRPITGGHKSQGLHGHNGVDLAAPVGTPIYAAAEGTVILSIQNGGWNGGYGNYIIISHPNETQTLYSHNSVNYVSVGDKVKKGELIGKIGMTGKTTGPHVHFEIRGARNPF